MDTAIQWKKVFDSVVRLMQLDPDTADLTDARKAAIVDNINHWVRAAWEYGFWPDLTYCEERDVTTKADDTKYVPWEEADKETIGHVRQVAERNPRGSWYPQPLGFGMIPEGAMIGPNDPDTVWVEFRIPAREFTMVAYAGDTTYGQGDLAYDDTTGETYKSLQDSNTGHAVTETDWWELVEFPWKFYEYVRKRAYADELRQDGDKDKAKFQEDPAQGELDRVWDVETAQQKQTERAQVQLG